MLFRLFQALVGYLPEAFRGYVPQLVEHVPSAARHPSSAELEVMRDRIAMIGLAGNSYYLNSYARALEDLAEQNNVSFTVILNMVDDFIYEIEPRIKAVLPSLGTGLRPQNEVILRLYVHHGRQEEDSLMRLAYIEEKTAFFNKALSDLYEKSPLMIKARRDVIQMAAYQRAWAEPILAKNKDRYITEVQSNIWCYGPEYAAQRFEGFEDYFSTTELSFQDRMKARGRIRRRDEKAANKDKMRSTARQRRHIDMAFQRNDSETHTKKPTKTPEEILSTLLDQAQSEYEWLQDDIASRMQSEQVLKDDIARLRTELEFEQEIAADHAAKALAAAHERQALVARIAQASPHGFSDERAAELNALEHAQTAPLSRTPEKPAGVNEAPPTTEENSDIDAYLRSPDPAISGKAQAIATLRASTLPLESQWTQLGNHIDLMLFQSTYIQKQIAACQKQSARADALLTELVIEQAQLEFMLGDLANGNGHDVVETAKYPASLDVLDAWAKANLKGRVILTKRAVRGAAQSRYEKPEHVYAALELLGNEFWNQKTAGTDKERAASARAAFMQAANRQHLSVGGSISSTYPTFLQEYSTMHEGRSYFMESHLGRGVIRDQRYSMRIYYTWDDAKKAVIVGHLPSHLNTLTS